MSRVGSSASSFRGTSGMNTIRVLRGQRRHDLVRRSSPRARPPLWAHEYGHNVGLSTIRITVHLFATNSAPTMPQRHRVQQVPQPEHFAQADKGRGPAFSLRQQPLRVRGDLRAAPATASRRVLLRERRLQASDSEDCVSGRGLQGCGRQPGEPFCCGDSGGQYPVPCSDCAAPSTTSARTQYPTAAATDPRGGTSLNCAVGCGAPTLTTGITTAPRRGGPSTS
jgi:hypothetical protein